ncbi:MAG: hypothetical protein U0168_10885 [Nannocystaceae bacterium]
MVQLGLVLLLFAGAPPWRPEGTVVHEGDTATRLRLQVDLEGAYWQGRVHASPLGAKLSHQGAGVLGYRRVAMGFGMGWGLGEYVVIGARGSFELQPERAPDGTSRLTRGGSFAPYVELLFARARGVRPFVLGRAGIGSFQSVDHSDGRWGPPTRAIVPTVGLGLGTHAFITEDLAFDLQVVADYRWNLRPRDGQSFETGYALRDANVIVAAFAGFSRWF